MKSSQGYKGYVIEARSCELRDGGFGGVSLHRIPVHILPFLWPLLLDLLDGQRLLRNWHVFGGGVSYRKEV